MNRTNAALVSFGLLAACLVGLAPTPVSAQPPRCDAPRVLLVVDKSSSMLGALPAGGTKWDAATTAVGELTAAYESTVDFGLMVFPFPDRCEPGQITMDVGPHPAADVFTALGTPPPTGGSYTPMAQTLDGIASYAPLLDPEIANHVILITDGEDHEGDPEAAAQQLKQHGVKLYVVGIGSRSGEPIPTYSSDGTWTGYVRDSDGQLVTSALTAENETRLRALAESTGGKYFRARRGSVGIDQIRREMRHMRQAERRARRVTVDEERYPLALLPAFLLLVLEGLLPTAFIGRRRRRRG